MEKFLQYVCMKDDDGEFLFPSPIGHIVFVILTFICFATCNNKSKEDEVKHIDMSIAIDTTRVDSVYQAEEVILETDSVFKVPKGHHWSSKEIGLPIGIIYMMDFAGSGTDDQNQADNYVTIKRTDGSLVVTRDIDIDLYLSLVKGDTIR